VPDAEIARALDEIFDFRPASIIRELGLRSPIFGPTATYGHFGRIPEEVERLGSTVRLFPWEETTRIDDLRTALGL
jgi:S-adenosylmethionine synthetase